MGQAVPFFSGTRTGFNFKASSYREKLLQSVTRYMPKEFASEFKKDNDDDDVQSQGSATSGTAKKKPYTK